MSLKKEGKLRLNKEQEEAVRHKDGPLLIFAGAGSGKTRVITNRIQHLITNHHVEPKKIVALSFTNKSAREMKTRIRSMIPRNKTKGLELSTFHALGLKICKAKIEALGYKLPFSLLTPNDLELIVLDLLKSKKIDPKAFPIKSILSRISLRKNTGALDVESWDDMNQVVDVIFEDYETLLKEMNSMDFDDLILKPNELFEKFPEIKEYYNNRYRYLMIDEFQDTNETQYKFIKNLLGGNQNLCVVGDDDQSIYGFRGSNKELILNFERDFQNTKVIKLLRNYRSSVNIIHAANSLIIHNTSRRDKQLWSENHTDEKPFYTERYDERDEASFVADKIQELVVKKKRKGSEIAILFRTNYQSRPFEEELKMRGIPYKLIGAYNFFDRKEVKDLLAYVRVIANHKDELSLMRILNYPRRGLGQNSQLKIQEKARDLDVGAFEILLRICENPEFIPEIKKNAAGNIYELVNLIQKYHKEFYSASRMAEALKNLIKEVNFEKEISMEEEDERIIKARMLNLSEVVNMLSYFETDFDGEGKPTLFDFLLRLSLMTSDDENNENKDEQKVQMMTMHLSKGLEFESVFLVGIEEGIIPSSRSIEADGVDEERRLMYVGITRAKQDLFLSGAQYRKKFGESIPCQKSRFIDEINNEYLIRSDLGIDESGKEISFLDALESLRIP